MDDALALAIRVGDLLQLLNSTIQRVATLEVQVEALSERLDLLETQADDTKKLPYFQQKTRENT